MLGEMSVDEIKETILDPSKRILKKVIINDVLQAEESIKICMGTDASIRRQFIEKNAYLINEN